MRIIPIAALLAVLVSDCAAPREPASGPAPAAPPAPTGTAVAASEPGALPRFSHVFIVVLENYDGAAFVPAEMPYLTGLAARGAAADRYAAVAHPSLPNYLALLAGDTFGVQSDCSDCFQSAANLADQVERAARSWKGYMEDLPRPCFTGASAAGYALKHDPFLYFRSIRDDAARCGRVVPLGEFGRDLAGGSVPDLAWVTPNLCHDGHDCEEAEADRWLGGFLPTILESRAWRADGVLFIVWDEADAGEGERVPLLALSPLARAGYRSATPYTHYSLLRTIEEAWGLAPLGRAAEAAPMADLFRG
jgi:hypothetical protein